MSQPRIEHGAPGVLWSVLFLLVSLSLAVPYFAVAAPPMLDYPNHLARTFILAHLHDPAYHFTEIYRADWRPYPYILWDALVVAAQRVLPAELAGRIVVALAAVMLPISVACFLDQANHRGRKLAFLGCALAFCPLFLWGFTAYQLGVSMCFFMVAAWLRFRRRPSLGGAAVFVVATFLAYFAHILGFATAAFILTLYEFAGFEWRWCLRLSAFLAPPSLLFLWARPGLHHEQGVEWRPLSDKWPDFIEDSFHGYNGSLDQFFLYGLALCALLAAVCNREFGINRRWLFVAAGLFALYLALPIGWGANWDIDARLALPVWLVLPAAFRVGRRASWIAAVAILLTAVRLISVTSGFLQEAARNAAMDHAIQRIPHGARVFPLVDRCDDEDPLRYSYGHYWAYSVIRRGALTPALFDIPGQTPMRIESEWYTGPGHDVHCYDVQPDWDAVARDYDFIWSFGDQRYLRGISHVADPVYAESSIILYRVRGK